MRAHRFVLAVLAGLGADSLPAQGDRAGPIADQVTSVQSLISGEGPTWAPDGTSIYFGSTLGGVWAISPTGGAPYRVTREISTNLVRVSPAGDQLAYLSDKDGNPEIWLWSFATGRERRLTNLGARINALSWSPDALQLAFSALEFGQFDLYTVDIASGRVRRITRDERYETYPVWSPDGRSLLYFRADDRWADHELMLVPVDGGEPRIVAADTDLFDYGTIGTRSKMGYPLLSPDGRSVLFKSHRSGWINYWLASVAGGPVRHLAAEAADQSDARWSPDGKWVAFASIANGTQHLKVVPATGGATRQVTTHLTGVAAAPDWSPDGTRLAFLFGTPTRPLDLHVVELAGGVPVRLTRSIDPTAERSMVVPEKVTYQSDQFTISGYLFRPPSTAPKQPFPGVMYIHGGPTSQFADSYLAQAQFLAQTGYLVLAPNIRGSSGYGKAFEDANNPCWTHCDLRDVLAGVEYLKRLPEIDRDHIGITGNSYGGIMSMGAIAHAPGVFQAAVPQSGYANWISFQDYNTELQHTKLNAYEWGPYPDSADVYRRNSAIFSAHRVSTPVFLVQGEGIGQAWRPGVYPIIASLEFAHALDRLNKVVKLKTYPGEGYYVSGRENSRQVLVDIHAFFEQHLRALAHAPGTSVTGARKP